MTTTRRDLERIAGELRDVRPPRDVLCRWTWAYNVQAVADALNVTTGLDINGNRKFRRDRFYAAAGVEPGELER